MQVEHHTHHGHNLQHVMFEDAAEAASHAVEVAAEKTGGSDSKMRKWAAIWISGKAKTETARSFRSWAEASDAVTKPWEKGQQRITQLVEELKDSEPPEIKSRQRKRRWTEDDGEMDTDRFLGNMDDFYCESKRETTHGPSQITILVGISCQWSVSEEAASWRGAVAAALCGYFEEAGYPCEMIAYQGHRGLYSSRTKHYDMVMSTRVKECGEELEMNTIASATSPWYFRTLGFMLACMHHSAVTPVCFSLGQPITSGLESVFAKDLTFNGDLVLEIPQVFSKDAAVRALHQLMEVLSSEAY